MFFVKRLIPFCFCLLLNFQGKATAFEDKNGIGVVDVVVYNFFSLDFYKKPGESISDDGIYFYRDTVKPILKYKFSSTGSDEIPYWFDPQTFIITKEKRKFQFVCIEKQNNWCKIITNKELGNTKWVELGFDVTYSDWQIFLPTVSKIEIEKDDSLLFDNPADGSTSTALNLNYDHNYIQTVRCKEVQGMWMSVEIIEKDELGKVINTRTGWIKWRDENDFLISWYA